MKYVATTVLCIAGIFVSVVGSPTRSAIGGRSSILTNSEPNEYTAKDYIQDGLIALWDGIENADWGVRDETSTEWVDLCQPAKSKFHIYEGKSWWGKKSFEFNETYGERIGAYRFPSDLLGDDGACLEICLRLDYLPTTGNRYIFCLGGQTVHSFQLVSSTPWSQRYNFTAYPMSDYAMYDPSFVGSGMIYTFSNSSTAELQTMFCNGAIIKTAIQYSPTYNGAYACCLACNYAGTIQGIVGGIFCIRVYDRALTDAEISWNAKIDKVRFGL